MMRQTSPGEIENGPRVIYFSEQPITPQHHSPGCSASGSLCLLNGDTQRRGCLDHRGLWRGEEYGRRGDSYLLEQRRQPYALLDLDFLGWGVNSFDDSVAGNSFMLRNLAAVVSNYREGGIRVFVLAYFVSSHEALRGI